MDKEYVSEDLVQDVLEHFEFVWKKTKGQNVKDQLVKLHNHLHKELALQLYMQTLENVKYFVGVDHSFHNFLCTRLDVTYFKKGADIIRCNDIQGKLFFICKGTVDILVAGTKVSSMCSGGIFGKKKFINTFILYSLAGLPPR